MKVFYTSPNCSYSGGVVLIAANSSEEALQIAAKEIDYAFTEWDYDKNCDVATYNTYYEWEEFKEFVGLTYDTDIPKLIMDNFFAE